MENQDIRIINLPAMRVASFYAFSSHPETDAWEKMIAWAKTHGLWQEPPSRRIFGFNTPNPSAGSPNYGYEFWITIDPSIQLDKDMTYKDFSGGLYGVLRCDVSDKTFENIGNSWKTLVKWLESSHYKQGNHQCLDEHLTRFDSTDQGFILDLYIPITE
jgi:AraC family transcriptional regulator